MYTAEGCIVARGENIGDLKRFKYMCHYEYYRRASDEEPPCAVLFEK